MSRVDDEKDNVCCRVYSLEDLEESRVDSSSPDSTGFHISQKKSKENQGNAFFVRELNMRVYLAVIGNPATSARISDYRQYTHPATHSQPEGGFFCNIGFRSLTERKSYILNTNISGLCISGPKEQIEAKEENRAKGEEEREENPGDFKEGEEIEKYQEEEERLGEEEEEKVREGSPSSPPVVLGPTPRIHRQASAFLKENQTKPVRRVMMNKYNIIRH